MLTESKIRKYLIKYLFYYNALYNKNNITGVDKIWI